MAARGGHYHGSVEDTPRICSTTGLSLVPGRHQPVFRLAKESWGAMNPAPREADADRLPWGRYDTASGRTIYAAESERACYAESLAAQRLAESIEGRTLASLFGEDSHDDGLTSLLEAVTAEWQALHHQAPRCIAEGWRTARVLYTLRLPTTGWFVEIETAESIAAISRGLADQLFERHIRELTVADLRGRDRDLTTMVAEWVRAQTLEDGSLAHGIQYESKHSSSWTCWAIWLRAIDRGEAASSEPTQVVAGRAVRPPDHNPALAEIESLLDLHVF